MTTEKGKEKLLLEKLNAEASARKESLYQDPTTGLFVMTSFALRERGECCKSGCRHCPYGYKPTPE